MSISRVVAFAAILVFTSAAHAAERTVVPSEAPPAASPQASTQTSDQNGNRVCYQAGDRNGFETCTDIDRRDCSALANGTLICETAP